MMKLKQPRNLMTGAMMAMGLGLCAGQVMANEIRGTLDGEPHEWHVLSEGDMSTANFSELMPGMVNVTVQGHREARYEPQRTRRISFLVMQGAPSEASVTYFHERGLTRPHGPESAFPIECQALELAGVTGR